MERHIKLFPSQVHEGERKWPTVVRGALRVNGVGVGFDAAARTGIAMDKVRAQEIKLRVLEKLTPALGRQTAELLGRFTLKAATAPNAALITPAINVPPRTSVLQLRRAITSIMAKHPADINALILPSE